MANVWPIISGTIVDRRDQVLRILFSPPAFICSIRPSKRASTNGPLDTERGMVVQKELAYGFRLAMMNFLVCLFRRVLYPLAFWPQGYKTRRNKQTKKFIIAR